MVNNILIDLSNKYNVEHIMSCQKFKLNQLIKENIKNIHLLAYKITKWNQVSEKQCKV